MNKFSNILKLPPFSNHSLELLKNIYNKVKYIDPTKNIIESYNHYKKDMKVILQYISTEHLYPEKSINEITKNDDYVILTLNVLDYLPTDLNEFSQLYNNTTKETTFTKDYPVDKIVDGKYFALNALTTRKNSSGSAAKKNDELNLHYNFTLICRENPLSNNLIKLVCSSHDNEGV